MAHLVILEVDAEDYDWLISFDPDRERVASRADLVEVLADFQEILTDAYTGEEIEIEED